MASDSAFQTRITQSGIGMLNAKDALAAMKQILLRGNVQSAVLDMDWDKVAKSWATWRILDKLTSKVERKSARAELVTRLHEAPASNHAKILREHLQSEVQQVLNLHDHPKPDRGFFDLGMDSLMAVELGNRLQTELGKEHRISSTVFFDYPSIGDLAQYVRNEVLKLSVDKSKEESANKSELSTSPELEQFEKDIESLDEDELAAQLEAMTKDVFEIGNLKEKP